MVYTIQLFYEDDPKIPSISPTTINFTGFLFMQNKTLLYKQYGDTEQAEQISNLCLRH